MAARRCGVGWDAEGAAMAVRLADQRVDELARQRGGSGGGEQGVDGAAGRVATWLDGDAVQLLGEPLPG